MITARLVLFAALMCAPVAALASAWSPKTVAEIAPTHAAPDADQAPAARAEASDDWVVMGDPTRPFFLPPGAFLGLTDDGGGDDTTGGAVPCGEGRPVATPNNGMSGQGWADDEATAKMRSISDCMKKLIAYSGVKCGTCEDLSTCPAFASVLFHLVQTQTYQSSDGSWHAITTYKGPYFVVCEKCE